MSRPKEFRQWFISFENMMCDHEIHVTGFKDFHQGGEHRASTPSEDSIHKAYAYSWYLTNIAE